VRYNKATLKNVISWLAEGGVVRTSLRANGTTKGAYIGSSYVVASILGTLKQYKAIELVRDPTVKRKGDEQWGGVPGFDFSSLPETIPPGVCTICGEPFKSRGSKYTCGSMACRIEYTRRWKLAKRRELGKPCRNTGTNQSNEKKEALKKRSSLILSTGCQVVRYTARTPTDNARCEKYVDCKNRGKCLFEIPTGWEGFKCINDHPGYAEKESMVEAWHGDYANRSI